MSSIRSGGTDGPRLRLRHGLRRTAGSGGRWRGGRWPSPAGASMPAASAPPRQPLAGRRAPRPGGRGVSLQGGTPPATACRRWFWARWDSLGRQRRHGDASLRLTGPAARLSELTVAGGAERDVTGAAPMHRRHRCVPPGRSPPGPRPRPLVKLGADPPRGQSIWDLLQGLESDHGRPSVSRPWRMGWAGGWTWATGWRA